MSFQNPKRSNSQDPAIGTEASSYIAGIASNMSPLVGKSYITALKTLKEKIRTAQIKASLSVNSEMIQLYWEIGKTIVENQSKQGWGKNIIGKLSKDLQNAFPNMRDFQLET